MCVGGVLGQRECSGRDRQGEDLGTQGVPLRRDEAHGLHLDLHSSWASWADKSLHFFES